MATPKEASAPPDKMRLYERLLATLAGVDVKSNFGSAYTAVNGNMHSMISKHGVVGIRLPEPDRSAFLTAYSPLCAVQDLGGSEREAAYGAYGLVEMSPWLLLGEPKPPMTYFEGLIREHRAKGRLVAGNPFLLPGEFVADPAGKIILAYRYAHRDLDGSGLWYGSCRGCLQAK